MSTAPQRVRYSVSLVKQGDKQFYTLTLPSDVLAKTCKVSTRKEDPQKGFQRELDGKRAQEIADYIDKGLGTIPNSIVLSAQEVAQLKIVGRGKTVEFNNTPGAFLILDGQHRVFGFGKAKKTLRVPVVIYNNLTRQEESRLFIDINTKQKPVPPALLLDIKKLAEIETSSEAVLREIFDHFNSAKNSALSGKLSAFENTANRISRVTFNSAVKPLLERFPDRNSEEVFTILDNYLSAVQANLVAGFDADVIAKPVVFRALMGLLPHVARRVLDKFGPAFTPSNFNHFLQPAFDHLPKKKLEKPGTSWTDLRDYLEDRVSSKQTF